MHLDLYSDDPEAQVTRLVGLGARYVRANVEDTCTSSCKTPRATSSAYAAVAEI